MFASGTCRTSVYVKAGPARFSGKNGPPKRCVQPFVAQRVGASAQYGADSYVLHEHLEVVNEPVYFYQFAETAAAEGVQFIAEAIGLLYRSTWPGNRSDRAAISGAT